MAELGSEAEAMRAVEALNGKEVMGRWVTVCALYGMWCVEKGVPYHGMHIHPRGFDLNRHTIAMPMPTLMPLTPHHAPIKPLTANKQVEQCVSPTETKTIKIRGVPFAATPEDLSQYFGGLFGEGVCVGMYISIDLSRCKWGER